MSTTLVHPLPGYRLTDGFGYRAAIPGVVDAGGHTGQDIAAPKGTPIRAANSGTVRRWFDRFIKNNAPAGGNMVAIYGQGFETRYAHLDRYAVTNGQHVTAGQIIGYVGSTGAATGNHLHYEVLINGRYVNPLPYLNTPIPEITATDLEEEPMKAVYYYANKQHHMALMGSGGLFSEVRTGSSKYRDSVAKALTGSKPIKITLSHFRQLRDDHTKVRQGK